MQPIRLLIVEDNAMQRELYVDLLQPYPEIDVVCTAGNGSDALQDIRQLQPDVVLFDMVMPHMDGFALLDSIHQMNLPHPPAMIALTSLGRDDFIARAVALGVDDYLIKPVDAQQLAKRIIDIHQGFDLAGRQQTPIMQAASPVAANPAAAVQYESQPEALSADTIRKYAAMLLMQLDMPAHLHGYQYLLEALVIAVQTPNMVTHLTSQLYPAIAKQCGASASRVERSIRNAIAITWDRGGGAALNKILNRTGAMPAEKPTNGELIAQLAARIRMKEAHG